MRSGHRVLLRNDLANWCCTPKTSHHDRSGGGSWAICLTNNHQVSDTDLLFGFDAADLAPNFYPTLSSLRRLIMPRWAGGAMAMVA
jgi:outer membrane protein OmpA-like peptidoglycan-associated protein